MGYAGCDESVLYFIKEPTDTLQSNSTSAVGVSVGYY